MTPRKTTIDDLLRFVSPSEPRLSPDGSQVAFLVKTIETAKNRYKTQLYLVPADGAAPPRCLTFGESVSTPRWTPDGKSLLFARADEKKTQLWRLPLSGGEAEKLTDLPPGSLGAVEVSPDGRHVLYSFRAANDTDTEKAAEERKKNSLSTPPREITRLRWRLEGAGFLPEDAFHLYTLDLATKSTTKISSGTRDFGSPCWSPDGKQIAYVQNVAEDPDRQGALVGLFVLDLATSETRTLSHLGPKGSLTWSPDGKWLAFTGHAHTDETWGTYNAHPWLVEVATGEARDLTPDWDVTAGDTSLGEVYGRGDNGPHWASDSQSLAFIASDQGEVAVYTIGIAGGVPEKQTPESCSELGMSHAAGRRATLRLTPHDIGDIYVDGRRVTELNADLFAEVAFSEPVAFTAGDVPCFALLPEGDGPYPTILYIHGGPHAMYGRWQLFHEYHVLAAAGYAVLYPNPRGSKGYGEAWTSAIKGNWGEPAMADCLACVDYAIEQGWSNPEKLAVMGGSYGGYLTGWIVGHTDRFACAIAERGVYNIVSFGGTTDFVTGEYDYFAGNHTDDTEALRQNSPLTYANKVTTPLLVVHSEGDLRCPISQGDEYYRAVRRSSPAEVRYLRYGAEANHELSRGGPPDLRLDRQRRFHAWLGKYLR